LTKGYCPTIKTTEKIAIFLIEFRLPIKLSNFISKEEHVNWTIRNKTIVLLLIIGLLPMGVITLFTMNRVSNELLEINQNRLISLREEKKLQIEHYFKQIEGQLQTFANNEMIVNAMTIFNQAFKTVPEEVGGLFGEEQAKRLRERYVYQKNNTPGAADNAVDTWFPKNNTSKILQSFFGEDAIGQMGEGLSAFLQKMRQSIGDIGHNAETLASSAEELTSVSQQMAGNAKETSAQAGGVSTASTQVTASVQTVAASSEEMTASIKEIAENSSQAAKIATSAVTLASQANATVSKLGDSSKEVGEVIKVITSIAEQTNLLALNATIEAARAGEAGKGFAVVANEVKDLATQTGEATENIREKIEAIQMDTQSAITAIGEISDVINRINDISSTIASAVEEQTATTNEIGRSVNEAARGTQEIASNISGVAEAAQNTTQGATDTENASKELSKMAAQLQNLVGQFQI
jgi:methyl-accepting chemotaxis protein